MFMLDKIASNPEEFKRECRQREHRTTIAYLGLDLMFDREGDIHLIEINGQHSGTKGFQEAYGEDFARRKVINYLASFGPPVDIVNYFIDKEDLWAEELPNVKLKDLISLLNPLLEALSEPVKVSSADSLSTPSGSGSFEYGFRSLGPGYREEMHSIDQASSIVWNNTSFRMPFAEKDHILVNPKLIESITCIKGVSFMLPFPWMLQTYMMGGFNAEELCDPRFINDVNMVKSDELIFKPSEGVTGRGVAVIPKRKFINARGKARSDIANLLERPEELFEDQDLVENIALLQQEEDIVMQPYIHSKPFLSAKTGKYHHGSIRYIVMVHSNNGNISVEHIGAYNRLAPEPLGTSLNSKTANYSRKAIAEPVSPTDYARLGRFVEPCVQTFYRRALRLESRTMNKEFLSSILLDTNPNALEEPWRALSDTLRITDYR
jgi:hypothetical protein